MNFDQEFVQRLVQQDELAFATFYEKTVDDFFRYVISHYNLSEQECFDIVSDVFVKIRENLDKYDEKYSFWQFVRSILKNHCKDYFKKSKPLLFSQLPEEIEDERDTVIVEDAEEGELFNLSIDSSVMRDALCCLDRESQELIHARFVLWHDYDTISDMFSVPTDSVRQRVSRIIKKLRSTLAHLKT